jgi:hypothetical protein
MSSNPVISVVYGLCWFTIKCDDLSEEEVELLRSKMEENSNMFTSVNVDGYEIDFNKECGLSNEDMIEGLNELLQELGFEQKAQLTSEDHDQE